MLDFPQIVEGERVGSLQDCGSHVVKLVDNNYFQSSDQGRRMNEGEAL